VVDGHPLAPLEHPRCQLGEAPLWSAEEGALYFADIFGCTVHRLGGDGAHTAWPTGARVGALALHTPGRLIAGCKDGIRSLDTATGELPRLLADDPEAGRPDQRYNDCAVDLAGNLWIGTLDDTGATRRGALHRVAADGSWTTALQGVGLANGADFSPDGRRLYFTDTIARAIHVFDHDPASGRLGPARLFARDDDCLPDGLAVDADGCVWSAKHGGGRVVRYRPDGSVDRTIALPVSNPTSVAFGGARLDRLFITTASIDLADPGEPARGAGQVFVHDDPGAAGLPARRCRLPLPAAPSDPPAQETHAAR
jgi:sugar lactone lactonase YvrE